MSDAGESAPTAEPPEDRCLSCGGPLASDQRYCVNCGERRGKARFSLAKVAAELAPPPPPPAPAPRRRRPRMATGATLVTGVATLLLAMGVGVLIGHDSSSTPTTKQASAPVQVITVGGGGGTAAAGHKKPSGKQQKVASTKQSTKPLVKLNFKPSTVKLSGKTVSNAAASAQKVFGQRGNLAPPTIQPGQACSHGAGCQGGKFTGNFFH